MRHEALAKKALSITDKLCELISTCVENKTSRAIKLNGCRISVGWKKQNLWLYGVNVDKNNRGRGAARQALEELTRALDRLRRSVKLDAIP